MISYKRLPFLNGKTKSTKLNGSRPMLLLRALKSIVHNFSEIGPVVYVVES